MEKKLLQPSDFAMVIDDLMNTSHPIRRDIKDAFRSDTMVAGLLVGRLSLCGNSFFFGLSTAPFILTCSLKVPLDPLVVTRLGFLDPLPGRFTLITPNYRPSTVCLAIK